MIPSIVLEFPVYSAELPLSAVYGSLGPVIARPLIRYLRHGMPVNAVNIRCFFLGSDALDMSKKVRCIAYACSYQTIQDHDHSTEHDSELAVRVAHKVSRSLANVQSYDACFLPTSAF